MRRAHSILKGFALAGALVLSLGTAAHAAPGCTAAYPALTACRYQSTSGGNLVFSGTDVGPGASITINGYVNGVLAATCTNSAPWLASCTFPGPFPVSAGDWVWCEVTGATFGWFWCND